jgi:putative acetyltransferase
VRIAPEPFDSPDASALRAELAADIASRYGRDTEPGIKPTAADITVFLVARDAAGAAIGCGALRELDGGVVEIKRMYVRPAARGAGIGRAVLAALEAESHRRGFDRVLLETGTLQHEAIRLYERAGYAEIPCFGAYAGVATSRCYARGLPSAPDE